MMSTDVDVCKHSRGKCSYSETGHTQCMAITSSQAGQAWPDNLLSVYLYNNCGINY